MGLDWNPGPKAKAGCEEEFRQLWDKLQHPGWFESNAKREKNVKRFHEITQSAYETLGAPQVGIDASATEWARTVAFPQRTDASLSEEAFIQQMRGFYVLDLLPPSEGLPAYSNGFFSGELTSFRGQFLKSCEEIIGRDLLKSAYVSKLPEETIAYGDKLLEACKRFAAARNIELDDIREPKNPDSVEFNLDVVRGAGRWCRFWGEKGHWLEADF